VVGLVDSTGGVSNLCRRLRASFTWTWTRNPAVVLILTTHPEWTTANPAERTITTTANIRRAPSMPLSGILRDGPGYKNDNDSNDEHDDDENGDGEEWRW
jgi:hypothetical protein